MGAELVLQMAVPMCAQWLAVTRAEELTVGWQATGDAGDCCAESILSFDSWQRAAPVRSTQAHLSVPMQVHAHALQRPAALLQPVQLHHLAASAGQPDHVLRNIHLKALRVIVRAILKA